MYTTPNKDFDVNVMANSIIHDGIQWVNTQYFREAAIHFMKHKNYDGNAPFKSLAYMEYWNEQILRSKEGYKVGNARITGYNYWFLNFSPMNIVEDPSKHTSKKVWGFPRFWNLHYEFFTDQEKSEDDGKHLTILKPRGTGFSEIFSAMGSRDYTLYPRSRSFYFAYDESYLNKDGILSKCWDKLEFLNKNTNRAFKHLRQVKNSDLHKRASYIDNKGNEKGFMSEIIGKVIDKPHKVKGARTGTYGKVYFEEAGAFKNLEAAVTITRPLVEQGGVTTAQIIAWGCVCAGTKVYDKHGKIWNIEDLPQHNGIIGFDGQTAIGQDIIGMNRPAIKPCYRIRHSGGYIECSYDHPLLVLRRDDSVQFIRAADLTLNDYVLSPNQIPIFGSKHVEDARLIGLLIGDGTYGSGKYNIQLCSNELEVQRYIEQKYSVYRGKVSGSFVQYNLKPLGKFRKLLVEAGILGQKSIHKTLPSNIHEYSKESLAELLAGYFDADGSVKYCPRRGVSIQAKTISKQLAIELKYQLLKLGIYANVRTHRPKDKLTFGKYKSKVQYELYINRADSIRAFADNIKLLIDHKREKINMIYLRDSSPYVRGSNLPDTKFTYNGCGSKYKGVTIKNVLSHKIQEIKYIGHKTIYNLHADTSNTYLANGIITHNTGGDPNADNVVGLENLFRNPGAYNMMEFDNVWEDEYKGQKCGWFFPVYRAMDRFTDEQGNCDEKAAKAYHDAERQRIAKTSPKEAEIYIAEHPYTPGEALSNANTNIFPVRLLQEQLTRLKSDKDLQGILKYGWIDPGPKGFYFRLDPNAKPIDTYPYNGRDTTGCVTMVESPYKDASGKVPPGIYLILVDPYYQDEADQSPSLGAVYVYKHKNNITPTDDDMLVAWYVGRPATTTEFHRIIFNLARFYNAKIQSELTGGGKGILDYAKVHKLLHYCEQEPDILFTNTQAGTKRNKGYFMKVQGDFTKLAHVYLADWLQGERSIKEGDDGSIVYTYNLHKIYDKGLLEELIKFGNGNFDRISAVRLLPFMIKDRIENYVQAAVRKSDFWKRPLFADRGSRNEYQLSKRDLMYDI